MKNNTQNICFVCIPKIQSHYFMLLISVPETVHNVRITVELNMHRHIAKKRSKQQQNTKAEFVICHIIVYSIDHIYLCLLLNEHKTQIY